MYSSDPMLSFFVFDIILNFETEAIDGSASPLKPRVFIENKLSSLSFDVACLLTESGNSSLLIPFPLSTIFISVFPPSLMKTSIFVAFASRLFSISSFTAYAGLSRTSPAAI